jgi:hypothetical protein
MKPNEKNPIPAGISEYIRDHFRDDYLTEVRTVKNKAGDLFYFVDVTHDQNLFHLKFDAHGRLVLQETEPILQLDDEEEIGNVD